MPEPSHPDLQAPFLFLVGDWRGPGRGLWRAEPPFRYQEELTISPVPERPWLRYRLRTTVADTGNLSHAEEGFLRLFDGGEVELVLAIPAGYTEIHSGVLRQRRLELQPLHLGVAPHARPLDRVERCLELIDGQLHDSISIAVGPGPVAPHVLAVLERRR